MCGVLEGKPLPMSMNDFFSEQSSDFNERRLPVADVSPTLTEKFTCCRRRTEELLFARTGAARTTRPRDYCTSFHVDGDGGHDHRLNNNKNHCCQTATNYN
jgi:hypothetical protein